MYVGSLIQKMNSHVALSFSTASFFAMSIIVVEECTRMTLSRDGVSVDIENYLRAYYAEALWTCKTQIQNSVGYSALHCTALISDV